MIAVICLIKLAEITSYSSQIALYILVIWCCKTKICAVILGVKWALLARNIGEIMWCRVKNMRLKEREICAERSEMRIEKRRFAAWNRLRNGQQS